MRHEEVSEDELQAFAARLVLETGSCGLAGTGSLGDHTVGLPADKLCKSPALVAMCQPFDPRQSTLHRLPERAATSLFCRHHRSRQHVQSGGLRARP
jgi:hypothetical protein